MHRVEGWSILPLVAQGALPENPCPPLDKDPGSTQMPLPRPRVSRAEEKKHNFALSKEHWVLAIRDEV